MIVYHKATREGNVVKNSLKENQLILISLHDQDGVISILDNREGSIRPLGERGQKVAKGMLSVDDILKEVSSNGKEKRREGIPLSNPSGTFKIFTSSAIEKN
jgi:hypothetical protein